MSEAGRFYGSRWGPDLEIGVLAQSGNQTRAHAANNTGTDFRHVATSALDVKAIRFEWISVSSPGTCSLRYETTDTSTGKPTGTLYDTNATVTGIVPTLGVQTYTFSVLPTTGRTAGDMYSIVLLTTGAGTTQTIISWPTENRISEATYPVIVMTATDGTTRSNFAEGTGRTTPSSVSLVLEDDSEVAENMIPYTNGGTNVLAFGTQAVAQKFTVPDNETMSIVGYGMMPFRRLGTPAGDPRFRIFDAGDSVVSGSTVTPNRNYLTTVNGNRAEFLIPGGPVELPGGVYRLVLDSASSANSSNCWGFASMKPHSTLLAPSTFVVSTCPDVGTPSWTDSATADQVAVYLKLNDSTASASGSGGARRRPY